MAFSKDDISRAEWIWSQIAVLKAVEVLEYHDKNWLDGSNALRSRKKQQLLDGLMFAAAKNRIAIVDQINAETSAMQLHNDFFGKVPGGEQ